MNILRVENVVSGYGSMEVLHEVSLEVEEGQIVSVLGPNGAGKTTLLRTIFGVINPRKGKIFYKNKDISKLSPEKTARLGMCYVPQEDNIFPSLTVQENLEMGAFIRDDDWQPRLEEIYELFPDLTDRRKSRAGELSGGMRQMLAIGRALMLNPQLLLLDEPFVGIDPIVVQDIQAIIRKLRDRGIGILITDHSVRETLSVTDRAYIMYEGEILLSGNAAELASNEEARKLYLGERFRL